MDHRRRYTHGNNFGHRGTAKRTRESDLPGKVDEIDRSAAENSDGTSAVALTSRETRIGFERNAVKRLFSFNEVACQVGINVRRARDMVGIVTVIEESNPNPYLIGFRNTGQLGFNCFSSRLKLRVTGFLIVPNICEFRPMRRWSEPVTAFPGMGGAEPAVLAFELEGDGKR